MAASPMDRARLYKDQVLELRREGKQVKEIRDIVQIDQSVISSIFKMFGDPRPQTPAEIMRDDYKAVLDLYADGMGMESIGRMYRCSRHSVEKLLMQKGVRLRQKLGTLEIHKEQVLAWRDQGLSLTDIAKRLETPVQSVSRSLIKWGYRANISKAQDWTNRTKELGPLPELKRNEKYGAYRFLGKIKAQRTLWLFEHRGGWKETFTELQLREARMA